MHCTTVAECMCGHLGLLQNACEHICDTSVKVRGLISYREAIYGFMNVFACCASVCKLALSLSSIVCSNACVRLYSTKDCACVYVVRM